MMTEQDRERWIRDLEQMAAALRLNVAILPGLVANLRALAEEIEERS